MLLLCTAMSYLTVCKTTMKKISFRRILRAKYYLTCTLACIAYLATAQAQGVPANAIYGDFSGYWTSSTGSVQTTNDSNNLLAFTVTDTGVTTTYSTGVNNGTLDTNSVSYVASDFAAFPISNSVFTTANALLGVPKNWTGTIQNGSASDIVLNSNDLPNTYLSDGEQGLALGTVIFNTPSGSRFGYGLSVLSSSAVTDSIPDIIVTQMGSPSTNQDRFKFVDSSGNTVGSVILVLRLLITRKRHSLSTRFQALLTLPLLPITVAALPQTQRIFPLPPQPPTHVQARQTRSPSP